MVMKESDDAELAVGDAAPEFELPGSDGESYTLDSFDTEAVLLVFTCNHCPYAQAKVDTLNALAERYDDCAVVGVNPNDETEYPDDSFERMVELVADGTIAYDAYLRDDSQEVARAYGAACTPDPFLLAKEGDEWRVVYHGRLDDAQSPDAAPSGEPGFEVAQRIDALLAGEDVEPAEAPARGCSIKWKN
ncbi:thioredoxin family protein [Natronomonas sp. EA1]|uniref:thioredoxin family protein n=1 Tax=Natronomonas sp. EA1 TaxID=3421655 RepID=UPI003EBC19ED